MEETDIYLVSRLRFAIEIIGAAVIGIGVFIAIYQCVLTLVRARWSDYNKIWLTFARFLALALEFQLGADILSTAIAPS